MRTHTGLLAKYPLFWFLVVSLVAVAPRILFFGMPFERDEGAYAVMADGLGRGEIPYVYAFDHKPPGVYYIYWAAFKLFGHSIASPRMMACLGILAACFLVGMIAFRINRSTLSGIVSIIVFGVSSVLPFLGGAGSNTEVFTLPFSMAALLCILRAAAGWRFGYFWAGLLFGTASLIKQPAALIAVFTVTGVCVAYRERWSDALRGILLCFFGGLVAVGTVFMFYYFVGDFRVFWSCFYEYNASYAQMVSWTEGLRSGIEMAGRFLDADKILLLFGITGILWFSVFGNIKSKEGVVLLFFMAGCAASVSLGLQFYGHYFIFLLPVLALGMGLIIGYFAEVIPNGIVMALLFFVAFLQGYISVWKMTPVGMHRRIYAGSDWFVRTLVVGDYLRTAGGSGSLYVMGADPEIYWYSGLKPVSRYIYSYPIDIEHPHRAEFRQELISDFVRNRPDWLVVPIGICDLSKGSFWFDLIMKHCRGYQLVAANMPDGGEMLVGSSAIKSDPWKTQGAILVLRKRVDVSTGASERPLSNH